MEFINDKGESVVIDVNPIARKFMDSWDETYYYHEHIGFKYVVCLGILGIFKDRINDTHWILPVWRMKKPEPIIHRRTDYDYSRISSNR